MRRLDGNNDGLQEVAGFQAPVALYSIFHTLLLKGFDAPNTEMEFSKYA